MPFTRVQENVRYSLELMLNMPFVAFSLVFVSCIERA